MTEIPNHNGEFNQKKRKYFSDFALRHLEQMRILKKGGVLGKENKDWRNVSEHCLFEAVVADVLAEAVGADREKVVQSTILHDWFKRKEVERMKNYGGVTGHDVSSTEEMGLLKEFGVDQNLLPLIHANIPHSSEPEYLQNRSLEEKIVHFSDSILSGTRIVDFHERMDIVNQKPYMIDLSESYRSRYGGKSLFEIQVEVAEDEMRQFEKVIGIEQGTLYDFIKSKIEERIHQ